MSPYIVALNHYRLQFPTLDSLGAGDPPATWKTEYDRVAGSAFSELFVTNTSYEGANTTVQARFDQMTLLTALHDRRAELDSTYDWRTQPDVRMRPAGIRASIY